MLGFRKSSAARGAAPILEVTGLDVHYGQAHALQGVSLAFERGVFAVVGRNGMGKTTLCNAITGLVPAAGSVKLAGEEILGLAHRVLVMRRGLIVAEFAEDALDEEQILRAAFGSKPAEALQVQGKGAA